MEEIGTKVLDEIEFKFRKKVLLIWFFGFICCGITFYKQQVIDWEFVGGNESGSFGRKAFKEGCLEKLVLMGSNAHHRCPNIFCCVNH